MVALQAARSNRGVHKRSVEGGTLNRKLRSLEAAWAELEEAGSRKSSVDPSKLEGGVPTVSPASGLTPI